MILGFVPVIPTGKEQFGAINCPVRTHKCYFCHLSKHPPPPAEEGQTLDFYFQFNTDLGYWGSHMGGCLLAQSH